MPFGKANITQVIMSCFFLLFFSSLSRSNFDYAICCCYVLCMNACFVNESSLLELLWDMEGAEMLRVPSALTCPWVWRSRSAWEDVGCLPWWHSPAFGAAETAVTHGNSWGWDFLYQRLYSPGSWVWAVCPLNPALSFSPFKFWAHNSHAARAGLSLTVSIKAFSFHITSPLQFKPAPTSLTSTSKAAATAFPAEPILVSPVGVWMPGISHHFFCRHCCPGSSRLGACPCAQKAPRAFYFSSWRWIRDGNINMRSQSPKFLGSKAKGKPQLPREAVRSWMLRDELALAALILGSFLLGEV